jgi:hypothetical protein
MVEKLRYINIFWLSSGFLSRENQCLFNQTEAHMSMHQKM